MSSKAGSILPDGNPSGDPDVTVVLKMVTILRDARIEKGLTLRDLKDKMGISYAHLSRAERGLSHPGIVVLLRWCRALELSFEEIVKVALRR